jgi:hypothetical protein
LVQDNVQWQTFVNRVLAWVSLTQVYLDVVDDYELLTQGVQFDRGGEAFTGLFFFYFIIRLLIYVDYILLTISISLSTC